MWKSDFSQIKTPINNINLQLIIDNKLFFCLLAYKGYHSMILNKIRNNKNNMFFSVGRNKYKANDTENISGLIVKKIVPKKNENAFFLFFA